MKYGFVSLIYLSLTLILSGRIEAGKAQRAQTYNRAGDANFKTGVWTDEEDMTVIELHDKFRSENVRSIWAEISKVLHRRPKLIREHYAAKLDPNLSGDFTFTPEDDALFEEAKEIAANYGTSIMWAQLARTLQKPRLVVYFHYAEKNGMRNKRRKKEETISHSDEDEDASEPTAISEVPTNHPMKLRKFKLEKTDRSISRDSLISTQSHYPASYYPQYSNEKNLASNELHDSNPDKYFSANSLEPGSTPQNQIQSIHQAPLMQGNVETSDDLKTHTTQDPHKSINQAPSSSKEDKLRSDYLKSSRIDETLKDTLPSYKLFSRFRESYADKHDTIDNSFSNSFENEFDNLLIDNTVNGLHDNSIDDPLYSFNSPRVKNNENQNIFDAEDIDDTEYDHILSDYRDQKFF